MSDEKNAGMWAIIELFGHQRIAGFMSEQAIGGQSFIRIDVPVVAKADSVIAAHSKLFGAGAIYAISPVDEALAILAAGQIGHAPVNAYGIEDALANMPLDHRRRLLAGPE